MKETAPEQIYISFYTASILDWKPLLQKEKYKNLILDSFQFLAEKKRVKIYGFVIMPNHIHLLWKMLPPHILVNVQRDFMKFTAQQIKKDLKENHPALLSQFKSNQADRKYQFWQGKARNTFMPSREILEQKLDYIHHNPMQGKWMLANALDEYLYSSYTFYEMEDKRYGFLSHYREEFA
ncbi:MAG: transposase [Bacteroidota bacterium]